MTFRKEIIESIKGLSGLTGPFRGRALVRGIATKEEFEESGRFGLLETETRHALEAAFDQYMAFRFILFPEDAPADLIMRGRAEMIDSELPPRFQVVCEIHFWQDDFEGEGQKIYLQALNENMNQPGVRQFFTRYEFIQ